MKPKKTTKPARVRGGGRTVPVFRSDGSTVFRRGDPGVPDLAAEQRRSRGGSGADACLARGPSVNPGLKARIRRLLKVR